MCKNKGQGCCPKCGSDIDYDGVAEIVEESIKYPIKCLKCGFEGYEWYTMIYDCHSGEDGKDIDEDDNDIEITVRIAKRLLLARTNTLKATIERRYDEIEDAGTQYIYDEVNEALYIAKSEYREEVAISKKVQNINAQEILDWLVEMGDDEELSVIHIVEWLDKKFPGLLEEYNERTMD